MWMVLLVFLAASSAAHASTIHILLVGGQSNADGRANPTGLPTSPVNLQVGQADIPFYYGGASTSGTFGTLCPRSTQFGPEITFGRSMADFYAPYGEKVAVIKYAAGGTNLHTQWKAGGDATTTNDGPYYVTFQNSVNAGLSALRGAYPTATFVIDGMIWAQGESDIDDALTYPTTYPASDYGPNLTRFIADVRATFSANMPFFLSRISSHQTVYSAPTDPNYNDYLTLRAQQLAVATNVAGAYLIDTDGSSFTLNTDNLHYNAGGQMALGYAFASAMQSVVPAPILRVSGLFSTPASGQVSLAWDALTGATSYSVKRSLSSGGPYTTIATGLSSLSYADQQVISGAAYYYVVTAQTAMGESVNSLQVAVTPTFLPSPLVDKDIGTVGLAGAAYVSTSGTYTLIGSGTGTDSGYTSDSCNFAYGTMTGDGTLIAHVASLGSSGNSPRAGLMVRTSLDANAENVSITVSATQDIFVARKTSAGAAATSAVTNSGYKWVKIVRNGTNFYA